MVEGGTSTATPTWARALATQTVTYTITRQGGGNPPASITIDSTGIISVATSAVVADSGTYTITASGTGSYKGSTTADIVITITKAIQGTFTYSPLDAVEGGTTTWTSTPSWTGALANQTVTYIITRQGGGNLPASITIESTGIISVATSAVVADSGTYIITASGTGTYGGTKQTTITITVRPTGVVLTLIEGTFAYTPLNVTVGTASSATPTWTGALATQTVTYGIVRQGGGNLPASITIDSSTGIVNVATSAVVADSGTYTITATGSSRHNGNTTANITISVTGDIQGTFSYNPLNATVGTASSATPTWTIANQTVTYTITRQGGGNLPASITIDSSTGIVNVATSAVEADSSTYTITASGIGSYTGSTTANIVITITAPTGNNNTTNITATVSFTGIQALELTVGSDKDNTTINAIVRLANQPIPVWADIENKVGLLTRSNLIANTPKRIFTAKHYHTQDALKTNIGAMRATDFLQTNTAYKAYVFLNESVVQTLPFTTLSVPTTNNFTPTRTGFSMRFAPGVLPFDAERTYILNTSEEQGIYEVYTKEGEVLLLPLYMDSGRPLKTGWAIINSRGTFTGTCARYSCLSDSGYTIKTEPIYQNLVTDKYHKVFYGIQSFNNTRRDGGIRYIRDGGDGEPYMMYWFTD